MKDIPFFVVHQGNQEYLKLCIASIKEFHNVHLIGDDSNSKIKCDWYDSNAIKSCFLERFDRVYTHLSSNPEFFEKICFRRYILMYEYAKRMKIEKFVHCDSDLILLRNCNDLLEELNSYDCAFLVPEIQSNNRMTASPHFSYWTLDGLEKFIKFFIDKYENDTSVLKEKYEYHNVNNIPGGVCDMTLLYLFSLNNPGVYNLFEMNPNLGIIDFNATEIEDSHGLIHSTLFGCKITKYLNGNLWIKYNDGFKKAYCLHMQGKAKLFMNDAFQGNFKRLFFKLGVFSILRRIKQLIYKFR